MMAHRFSSIGFQALILIHRNLLCLSYFNMLYQVVARRSYQGATLANGYSLLGLAT